MSIETLKNALPEFAKDLKLNLGSVAADAALTDQQRWGALVATAVTTARAKAAVAATVNTGDAGGASDPVVGSFVMGMALADGASGSLMSIFVNPMGAIPTTAA